MKHWFRVNADTPTPEITEVSHDAEVEGREYQAEKDAVSGRKSREKGAAASQELYGTPEERAAIRKAIAEKYARMRADNPTAKVRVLHAALAMQFNVTQRTIRNYLKQPS